MNYDVDVSYAYKGEKENIRGYTLGYGWDPRSYTWSDFGKKLDVAYEKYKKLYKTRTELFMKQLGYVEGKEKRNKEHFEWLVRYQIQNWSIKEIADFYSTENRLFGEDTIRN